MRYPKNLNYHINEQLELENFMSGICEAVQEKSNCSEIKCSTCILSHTDNDVNEFKLYLEGYFNHDT